ncbi:uncharacterized protein GGS22DRAFT_190607 [Annulohypoxylon maeteangense]|uniref:uncharacterized protein n=1 Tax=Annulohypoxylon maeteangense TaxID=1927788 RepID=UPI002008CF31|nr:uncharacterized protein GGS22DRAFT_190607 [Annulohypoxylon maeteangense]KAI0883292.1 hypothetical protein GGS22DRAFT_190607 [Annulohypoxylon maeteangense]
MAALSASPRAHNFSPILSLTGLSRSLLFYVFILIAIHGTSSSQQRITSQHDTCMTHDSPNQHAQQHPELVSGNLNGTTLIVPISLKTARQLIPKEYGIAEAAYRKLLPSFPKDMYPMMAQIVHDHDVQLPVYNASIPDFSRASLEFPFVDIFGDGRSSFRWASTFLISSSNSLAIQGAEGYGVTVHPSTFDPPCDAYTALSDGTTYTHSQAPGSSKFMTILAKPSRNHVPYPLSFIKAVTNQPVFADPQLCDYFVRMYDTTLSSAATPVVADVDVDLDPFRGPRSWHGVYGWRMATAFLEPVLPEVCVRAG